MQLENIENEKSNPRHEELSNFIRAVKTRKVICFMFNTLANWNKQMDQYRIRHCSDFLIPCHFQRIPIFIAVVLSPFPWTTDFLNFCCSHFSLFFHAKTQKKQITLRFSSSYMINNFDTNQFVWWCEKFNLMSSRRKVYVAWII